MLKVCEICGEFFETKSVLKKYCCEGCAKAAARMNSIRYVQAHKKAKGKPQYTLVCTVCKKEFVCSRINAKYCSKKCTKEHRKRVMAEDRKSGREDLKKGLEIKYDKERTLESLTPNQLLRYGQRSRNSQLEMMRIQMEADRKRRQEERMLQGG